MKFSELIILKTCEFTKKSLEEIDVEKKYQASISNSQIISNKEDTYLGLKSEEFTENFM